MTQATPTRTGVKIPGIGRVPRRWVIVGGVAVVGIVGYAYWRRARANGAAAPGPTTTTDLSGNPGSIGDTGFVNPNPGASGSNSVNTTAPGTISTNDQWTVAATDKLVSAGWDQQFVITTLGKYLSGQSLTTTEADLVRAAWAVQGQPPTGNPPLILSTAGPAPGAPGTTPPPTLPATGHRTPRQFEPITPTPLVMPPRRRPR